MGLKYDLRLKPCSFAAAEPGEPWRDSAFLLETRVETARAVAECWPVTFSVAAKQDVQRCVKIAQDLGSNGGRVFLRPRCEEPTCSRLRRDGATNLRQPDSPVFFLTTVDAHVMVSRLRL
jgi:hypothetical protein